MIFINVQPLSDAKAGAHHGQRRPAAGIPAVRLDDCAYWDGGLFSNTPIDALLNLLEPDEIESLPIFTIDLFRTAGLAMPENLMDIQTRALALQYENRFWAEYGGDAGLKGFLTMLE